MGKRKLIASISSLIIVGTTIPTVTTACKTNYVPQAGIDINTIVWVKKSDSYINSNSMAMTGEYNIITAFKNDNQSLCSELDKIQYSIAIDDEYIRISMDAKNCIEYKGKTTVNIVNPASIYNNFHIISSNEGINSGVTYILEDEIDPNLFCSAKTNEEGNVVFLTQTLPLKKGGTVDIKCTDEGKRGDWENIKSVKIKCKESIDCIDDYFLYRCDNLDNLELNGIQNINEIKSDFLSECFSLTTINLKDLTYLVSIGDNFIANCAFLKKLILPEKWLVRDIGNNFLTYCDSLESLTMPKSNFLTTIGTGALLDCKNLTYLNMTNIRADAFVESKYEEDKRTFCTYRSSEHSPAWLPKSCEEGIKIEGDYRADIFTMFRDLNGLDYEEGGRIFYLWRKFNA